MPLLQLIYISTATKKFSEKELAAVLKFASQNNEKNKITGMLLYVQGHFIQVLEGEPAQVDELMLRIKADSRHSYIFVVQRNVIHFRHFPNWGMGFHIMTDADILSDPSFVDFFNSSFDSYKNNIKFGVPLIMLKAFAKNHQF
jgi:hypothetical protein